MILIKCEDRFADLGYIRSVRATGLFGHAGWLDQSCLDQQITGLQGRHDFVYPTIAMLMGDMLQKRCEMDFVERLGPIQDKPLAVQIIWKKVRHRSNPTYACLNNKLIHRPPQIDPMLGVYAWKDKFFYYETTKAIRPKMR